MAEFQLTLKEMREIAPEVGHFVFDYVDIAPLSFKAGQFISLHIPDQQGKMQRRNYSIANAPGENTLSIACRFISTGLASQLLFGMQPGGMVHASGPYGRFVLAAGHPQRYVFLATGTGVTPYRSMLPELAPLLADRAIQVVLLFGARTPLHVLYEEEFLALAAKYENFQFHVCYSRQLPEKPSALQHSGYVQNCLDDLALGSTDRVYLCGNPGMVDDALEKLISLGVGMEQICREKYIPAR